MQIVKLRSMCRARNMEEDKGGSRCGRAHVPFDVCGAALRVSPAARGSPHCNSEMHLPASAQSSVPSKPSAATFTMSQSYTRFHISTGSSSILQCTPVIRPYPILSNTVVQLSHSPGDLSWCRRHGRNSSSCDLLTWSRSLLHLERA
jgi:hypothetical protein